MSHFVSLAGTATHQSTIAAPVKLYLAIHWQNHYFLPMITKIISGAQSGADQAALDVAINLGIPHEAWIPAGWGAKNGIVSGPYTFREMPTSSVPQWIKHNILYSSGTLILSHGKLTGGSAAVFQSAEPRDRPILHVDLSLTGEFAAAQLIHSWFERNEIGVLNVAGARAEKDSRIYDAAVRVLETALHLGIIETNALHPVRPSAPVPRNVEEAVDQILSRLTLREKAAVAKMREFDLNLFSPALVRIIRENFALYSGNEELLESCRAFYGPHETDQNGPIVVIIRALWEKLKGSYTLRVVK